MLDKQIQIKNYIHLRGVSTKQKEIRLGKRVGPIEKIESKLVSALSLDLIDEDQYYLLGKILDRNRKYMQKLL